MFPGFAALGSGLSGLAAQRLSRGEEARANGGLVQYHAVFAPYLHTWKSKHQDLKKSCTGPLESIDSDPGSGRKSNTRRFPGPDRLPEELWPWLSYLSCAFQGVATQTSKELGSCQ